MKGLKIYSGRMAPSKNITPELIQKQFVWRNTGSYNGGNEIGVAIMEEPIWWNRPLKSDTLIKQEADGVYSYNFPLAFRAPWKAEYNVLLNKNNVPVAAMIKINPKWTAKQNYIVRNAFMDVVYDTLIDLGISKDILVRTNNDLLLNNKKFYGLELIEKGEWLSANCFITLEYTPEKELFDRLTGKYAKERSIGGIIEETHLFTKEQFVDKLLENFKKTFDQIP